MRTTLVDDELAEALRELLAQPGGGRVFRYRRDGELVLLGAEQLNEYIREHLGEEFSAKDFRTWGGTLSAAVALAEYETPAARQTEARARRRRTARRRAAG